MSDKNVIIEIDNDHVSILHHSEHIVYWLSEEWHEDPSIVPSILHAVNLAASGQILELRNVVDKPFYVGVTEVTAENIDRVRYYVSNMDSSGREELSELFDVNSNAWDFWGKMKEDEDNYDMHLYIAIIGPDEDNFEVVDSEVIDSFVREED